MTHFELVKWTLIKPSTWARAGVGERDRQRVGKRGKEREERERWERGRQRGVWSRYMTPQFQSRCLRPFQFGVSHTPLPNLSAISFFSPPLPSISLVTICIFVQMFFRLAYVRKCRKFVKEPRQAGVQEVCVWGEVYEVWEEVCERCARGVREALKCIKWAGKADTNLSYRSAIKKQHVVTCFTEREKEKKTERDASDLSLFFLKSCCEFQLSCTIKIQLKMAERKIPGSSCCAPWRSF